MNTHPKIQQSSPRSDEEAETEFELVQFLGLERPGELWLGQDPSGQRRLIRIVYRQNLEHPDEFEVCKTRLHAWAALTRGLPRHLQSIAVGYRSDPDFLYCVMEAPDEVAFPRSFTPTTLESTLTAHQQIPVIDERALILALAEGLRQLHRSGFVHGAVTASNVFWVENEVRLGLPDLSLGLPGRYLAKSLHPDSDLQSMVDLMEAVASIAGMTERVSLFSTIRLRFIEFVRGLLGLGRG